MARFRAFAVRGNGFTMVAGTAQSGATTFISSPRIYGVSEGGLISVSHFNITSNQTEWVRVGGTPTSIDQVRTTAIGAQVDAADNVFVAGTAVGDVQFGATSFTAISTNQPEIFLTKLDQTILTASKPATAGAAWSVYPNPAAGTAQLAGLPAAAQVRGVRCAGPAGAGLARGGHGQCPAHP